MYWNGGTIKVNPAGKVITVKYPNGKEEVIK